MRRNIKNDKVIKAITIGLATMIAATSAPVDALANDTVTGGTPETTTETTGETSENLATETQAKPDVVTADMVDVVTAESASKAIEDAADVYEDHAASVAEAENVNSLVKSEDKAIEAEVDKANDIIENSKNLNNEDLNNALVQTEVAEKNIEKLGETLDSVYLENATQDNNTKPNDRLQYEVSRDENDDLAVNDNCPAIGAGKATLQLSGQYGEDPDTSDKVTLKNRSVQGTYQAGMQEVMNAIKARTNGDEEKEKAALDNAKKYLDACEDKFGDSTKALNDAVAQYEAAKKAADAAQASYERVQGLIANAIKDTNSAQEQLDAAKDRAERLTTVADQNYGMMIRYFENEIGNKTAKYDENGELDVEASAKAALALTNNNKIKTGDGLTKETYALGREFMEQLIMLKLESEGAKDIVYGTVKGAKDVDGTYYDQEKSDEKAVISKDEKTKKDTVSLATTDDGIHYYSNVDSKMGNIRGRMNHIQVTYKDSEGNDQTKYYNIVYKGTDFEGQDMDLTKGFCFVAEVTYDAAKNKWSYVPYSEKSTFLDDYSVTKGYREAAAAVDKAKAEVQKLTDELKALSDKVATNNNTLNELKGKLDKAREAYDNSAQSLKDLRDLYMFMTEGVQPSDLVEKEPEGDQPGVLPPAGDNNPSTDDSTADTTDDGAGTGGDTVIDGGDVSVTIPGGFTLPAGLLDAVAPTGGTASGVLGVRTGGGTEADEGGVADSRTNVAPRADFGTVNKVLGSRQNKDNSQIVKKIKDNEIPLAEIPNMDDEVTMNWMWLLIIFLLGATGKKMYDEYKKKKEAEEAAKINK